MKKGLGWTFLIAALLLSAVAGAHRQTDADKVILDKISGLRSLDDATRAKATRGLALQIRALAPGDSKRNLAAVLSSLSTEGDFGRDTLQEVTTTLVEAVKQAPPSPDKNGPAFEYMELAQLSRYEGMKVALDSPDYEAAVAKIDALDSARRKADFKLNDIGGHPWTLSGLKGKVVVVNFWATWCPPCRKEMPDLEALYNQFKGRGLVILAISDETMAKVQPFIEEHKYTYPVLLDPGRKVNTLFAVDGIPKSFVYDRHGRLVAQAIDMRTRGQFLAMLAKAGLK